MVSILVVYNNNLSWQILKANDHSKKMIRSKNTQYQL